MALFAPDYYKDFKCIASSCRHSCCEGWQINIDEETLYRYRALQGEMGKRINIAVKETDGCAHFVLQNGKCPFLNGEGLCDVILSLGEDYLCQSCTDHPRFRSFLRSRTEIGLGLSCEEAVRLILTRKEKTSLICIEEGKSKRPRRFEKWLLREREALLSLAEDEEKTIALRTEAMLSYAKRPRALLEGEGWIPHYRRLERLDSMFDECLALWEKSLDGMPTGLDREGGKLLSYFIYRHSTLARSKRDFRARIAFCALCTRHVLAMTAARGGTLDALLDTARLYSSEIEYSEENTAYLMEAARH